MTEPTLRAKLEQLVKKWRKYAAELNGADDKGWHAAGQASRLNICADELSALLSEETQ